MSRRVVVPYPRGIRSGGPEAIHQLVHELRRDGVDAFVAPQPDARDKARVTEYERYDAPEVHWSIVSSEDVIVVPEVYLVRFAKPEYQRVFCWWLSVDNSQAFRARRYLADARRGVADRPRLRELRAIAEEGVGRNFILRARLKHLEHLVQSEYAHEYLSHRLGVPSAPLTDYIPDAPRMAESAPPRRRRSRSPRIAYNPAKGLRLVRQVQRVLGDVEWVPITGMTPSEVVGVLQDCDVYLDLGGHPGKDRLPREAALCGAAVVVGMRGSAASDVDVPLPHDFKVDLARAGSAIPDLLSEVLDDLPGSLSAQVGYRESILTEQRRFETQVRLFAGAIRSGDPVTSTW